MLSYCLKCRKKNTESKNPKVAKTKKKEKRKPMPLLKYGVCDIEKSRFIKEQEASGSSSSLGIRTALSQITLADPLLF